MPNVKTRKTLLLISLCLLLLTGLVPVGPVSAAQAIVFDSVQVRLWPERMGPSVFVSLDLELSPAVPLPQVIALQVPVNASMETILNIDERGSVGRAAWEETSDDDLWKTIQFSATSPKILVEYTDPLLVYYDQARTFNYLWLSDIPVNDLTVSVRQPYGAGDLVTHPPAAESMDATASCCTYTIDAGPVTAGISYGVNFHYIKDLQNADYPALRVAPVEPVDETTEGRTILPSTVVVWLLAIALVLIFLVALYYWWFQRNYAREQGSDDSRWTRRAEEKAIFCHECGSRSQPGDTYCRNCGTELRRMDSHPQ